jgi:hypothetical protein
MKIIKQINVYPELNNNVRQSVYQWCLEMFGNMHGTEEDDWVWGTKSNYERSRKASFDMQFKNSKHASMFVLRWGGKTETIFEDFEKLAVDEEVFNNLFEII